jgi:hypothetical protein
MTAGRAVGSTEPARPKFVTIQCPVDGDTLDEYVKAVRRAVFAVTPGVSGGLCR